MTGIVTEPGRRIAIFAVTGDNVADPEILTPYALEDRQLDNFNPLRAGGQANQLFPAAK